MMLDETEYTEEEEDEVLTDTNESQIMAKSYNTSMKARRSKRLSSKKVEAKKDMSLNVSVQDVRRQYKLLKQPLLDAFGYDIKEQDIYYLQDFFIELPKLKDVWKRIGFNKDIQDRRLETLYEKLIETFHDIIDSEEDLESNILASIDEQKTLINKLCLELSIKPSELKLKKAKSVLEEDDILRSELKNLEAEKHKRLDEYNKLVIIENEFSQKLCVDPVEKRDTVPSQKMLNELSERITELTELCKARTEEMTALKEEIIQLSNDLELSRSDSFAELIIMESIDDMPLGSDDIKRTQDFRDELKHKDNLIISEIKSLRLKIRELWSKLNIDNESLRDMVMVDELIDTKRNTINALRIENDLCVEIKMANMQKFIESVRVEIREYCQKMFIGKQEMAELDRSLLGLTDFTEELLTRHEEKKEELEFTYEESQMLFEKAAKWIKLWGDYIQFEEKTKDPARFKVRGYNMLAEEKQRKLFNSQLPKLEEDLRVHADEYQNTNDRKEFTINGLFWSEYIQRKKQDHEESKINERKEKQIMRDNMKKNESRYGSKPITPLAIRNKRKLLTTQHESVLSTPSRLKNSKVMKTETTMLSNQSKMGSKIGTKPTRTGIQPKLSVAAKRKSKTPAKNRFRKSRGLQLEATMNDTIKDKTAVSASASYQTINSTVGSNSSRLASTSRIGSMSSRSGLAGSKSKIGSVPPQSSSAKFAAASLRIDSLNVMHSTASNTFIEEENFENLETDQTIFNNNNKLKKSSTPANNGTAMPTRKFGANKFNFQHPDNSKYEKFSASQDINYTEFSNDLVKMNSDLKANLSRFGASTLGDRTNNLSTVSTKYSSTRSKLGTSTRGQASEKDKLTSTMLSMN